MVGRSVTVTLESQSTLDEFDAEATDIPESWLNEYSDYLGEVESIAGHDTTAAGDLWEEADRDPHQKFILLGVRIQRLETQLASLAGQDREPGPELTVDPPGDADPRGYW